MPFIVNPKPSVMTFGYEKCRCEFTMQSVQEITKLSITKVFPLNTFHQLATMAISRAMVLQDLSLCVVKPDQPHWFLNSSNSEGTVPLLRR